MKVLIANRGEIACRIIRTLRKMGIPSVAVYSDADSYAQHVDLADEAIRIGPAPVKASYLDAEAIFAAAKKSNATAIHPGYGLLSENAEFAEACERRGIVFLGPTANQMRQFGLKHAARELAIANDVPLLPGSGILDTIDLAVQAAKDLGYPVMVKSTAGGGGIGMRLCWNEEELRDSYDSVKRLCENNFANGDVFIEKYVQHARHIEAQVFGDGRGKVLVLGERDCSVQRRNQKVIEETPAPSISADVRDALLGAAKRLCQAANYRSAGTVEFLYDYHTEEFYFLEVNTRLQVEHCVTEEVTGIDLVEWMIRLGAGDMEDLDTIEVAPRGAAIQARLYAEDPAKGFQPSSGLLTYVELPQDIRVDTWIETSTEVTPNYDPLLAKLIAKGDNRGQAVARLRQALGESRVRGIETNREYLCQILDADEFKQATHSTKFCDSLDYKPHSIEVLEPGTQTTVQDYPGRIGYWDIGVPPSGPFDPLSFRIANHLLGNDSNAAGLELTVNGPILKFNNDTLVCLAGASMLAKLDGKPIEFWKPIDIKAGSILKIGKIQGHGARAYLAIQGGLKVPDYLGSKATFTLGQFGGHSGRALQIGDTLHFHENALPHSPFPIPHSHLPQYTNEWKIRVLYGPHGSPDYFTEKDIETFFATTWEVHYNSARTGVRLLGPKPEWARADGGEAGLHPSNIHDNAYAIGAIDFTGDMPVILGPDGPSLGGFVCPATLIKADLWIMGQLSPGDKIKFVKVDQATATEAEIAQESLFASDPQKSSIFNFQSSIPNPSPDSAILHIADRDPRVVYRRSGDKYLLIEYGEMVLDLNLRFRVHALKQAIIDSQLPGIQELTPGIRSLQIHYESLQIPLGHLVDKLVEIEERLPPISEISVPTRIVHLPLSWDDEATRLAIRKYEQSVWKNAPWCPSNIEFIRRINGLDSIQDVKDIVFNANYLVMGLGDVYLGAPVATPVDPRHRLVTTKYNPARTWTPENAVGIGGAYLCIYGMEGPGGYQFVGRTIQMWNRYKATKDFEPGKPWLLHFFDQIKFYEVEADELLQMRSDFIHGRFQLEIEEATFDLKSYNRFLEDNQESIAAFKSRQQKAFDKERERWKASGQNTFESDPALEGPHADSEQEVPEGCKEIKAHVPGNVWKISVQEGDTIKKGEAILIVESMKMEISIFAEEDCLIEKLLVAEGTPITNNQTLCYIKPQ